VFEEVTSLIPFWYEFQVKIPGGLYGQVAILKVIRVRRANGSPKLMFWITFCEPELAPLSYCLCHIPSAFYDESEAICQDIPAAFVWNMDESRCSAWGTSKNDTAFSFQVHAKAIGCTSLLTGTLNSQRLWAASLPMEAL
jgi:hypothetical protein